MGSFDTVSVVGPDERIVCAHGHVLSDIDFQTKGLGCTLQSYYLAGGQLCAPGTPRTYLYDVPEMPMHLRTELPLIPVLDPKRFEMYVSCPHCDPVFTLSRDISYITNSRLCPHRTWASLVITTERGSGRIIEVAPGMEHEMRDGLRARLARGGSAVLADDDPEVVRYMRRLKGHEPEDRED